MILINYLINLQMCSTVKKKIMEKNKEGKTAVIFGATGLTGKELLKQLAEDSHFDKVIVVTRREFDFKNSKVADIVLDNFLEVGKISDKLNADVFFICTGTTIKKAGSKDVFREIDYEIPVRIAKCAQSLEIPSMVVISSIGADCRSSNYYLRTKGEMEVSVSNAYKGHLKFVRPSLLLGKRDEFRAGEYIASLLMKSLGWIMVGPLKKYRGINASEVAGHMVQLSREG